MFVSATREILKLGTISGIVTNLKNRRSVQRGAWGGARNNVCPTILAKLFDWVRTRVPRQQRHYALLQVVDLAQIVLDRQYVPTKIYWDFCKVEDPFYYAFAMKRQQLRSQGQDIPRSLTPVRPKIGLTRARTFFKSLNTRLGKDHKDICADCYKHDVHIALAAESGATAATKKNATIHEALKKEHMRRADRANYLQNEEKNGCLAWNDYHRLHSKGLVCTCGLTSGNRWLRCTCKFRSREGFIHLQVDKGSRLGVPMIGVSTLWYKSRSAILVEHITDYSRIKSERRFAYMWEESMAAGGMNNMISVHFHYVCTHQSGRKGISMWVDNNLHEFKNWGLVFYMLWLVQVVGMFDWFEIKYYEKGHSAMGGFGPDSTHAKITTLGRLTDIKAVPEDWLEIARTCAAGEITVEDFGEGKHIAWDVFLGQFYAVRTKTKRVPRPADARKPDGSEYKEKYSEHRWLVDTSGNKIDLRDYRCMRVDRTRHLGVVQAFKDLEPGKTPVLIACAKANQPVDKECNRDPEADMFKLGYNPLTYNQLLGIMAGWEFFSAPHRAYWTGRLVHNKTIVDGILAKKKTIEELEELAAALKRRDISPDGEDEDGLDDGEDEDEVPRFPPS